MAPHSSTLAWKIPWTEEPERLRSMRYQRVGHDWVTSLSLSCIGEGNGNPLQCSCLIIPGTGEPGGLPSMRSHRVGHDWSDLVAAATAAMGLAILVISKLLWRRINIWISWWLYWLYGSFKCWLHKLFGGGAQLWKCGRSSTCFSDRWSNCCYRIKPIWLVKGRIRNQGGRMLLWVQIFLEKN